MMKHFVVSPVIRLALGLLICIQVVYAETKNVAVIPPLIDSAWNQSERQTAADFQNALEVSLYEKYDLQMVSRSQLSTVAFENKARILKNPELRKFNVVPCQNIILSVYRAQENLVSIFAIENKPNGKPGKAIEVTVKSKKDIDTAVAAAVKKLAKRLRLSLKKDEGVKSTAVDSEKPIAVAITSGSKDALTSEFAEQIEYLSAQLTMSLQDESDKEGTYQLVDRQQLADAMEELKISEADVTTNLSPVSIQTADILLQPVVFFDGKQPQSAVSAIDPQSSLVLNMIKVNPDAIDGKVIQEFLTTSLQRISSQQLTEDESLRLRKLESAFYTKQLSNLLGLRMHKDNKSALKLELAQAAVGLCADSTEETVKAMSGVISKVSGSGLKEEYLTLYKRNFFLVIQEMENVFSQKSTYVQSKFWSTLGDEAKSLACVIRPEASEYRANLYQSEARSLFNLERYQECVDLILSRKRFSTYAMFLVADSYRKMGQFKKEQRILYRNVKSIGKSEPRLLRVMSLTKEFRGPLWAIDLWDRFANKWSRLHPEVMMELAKCFEEAGNQKFAADVYQSVIWRAEMDNKQVREAKKFGKPAQEALRKLGVKLTDFKQITPASVLKLNPSTSVEVITDDTIALAEVKKACQVFADFWGLDVHIYYNTINFTESENYDPVRKTLNVKPVTLALSHHSEMKSPTSVQRYYLTNQQLISIRKKGYRGSVFSSYGMNYGLFTTHYINKFKSYDKRPLEHITAIMLGGVDVIRRASEQEDRKHVLRIPPYIFSNNSNLSFQEYKLTISNEAAELLSELSVDRLTEMAISMRNADRRRAAKNPLTDTKLIQNASQKYNNASPIIISPK